MLFSKEHTIHINNHDTKISACCKLPPALLLFLLVRGCNFTEAQNPSSKYLGCQQISLYIFGSAEK